MRVLTMRVLTMPGMMAGYHAGYDGRVPCWVCTPLPPGYIPPPYHLGIPRPPPVHAAVLTVWPVVRQRGPGLNLEINNEDKDLGEPLSLKGVKKGGASLRRVTPLLRENKP